jgi:hypothetical protein
MSTKEKKGVTKVEGYKIVKPGDQCFAVRARQHKKGEPNVDPHPDLKALKIGYHEEVNIMNSINIELMQNRDDIALLNGTTLEWYRQKLEAKMRILASDDEAWRRDCIKMDILSFKERHWFFTWYLEKGNASRNSGSFINVLIQKHWCFFEWCREKGEFNGLIERTIAFLKERNEELEISLRTQKFCVEDCKKAIVKCEERIARAEGFPVTIDELHDEQLIEARWRAFCELKK